MLLRYLLGAALRRMRHDRGLTLEALARLSSVSVPYLSEIERGRKEVSSEVLACVCAALDITLDQLLDEVRVLIDEAATMPRRRSHAVALSSGAVSRAAGTRRPVTPHVSLAGRRWERRTRSEPRGRRCRSHAPAPL